MDSRISILGVTDDDYAPYYGVLLTSLFECNKKNVFNVFFLVGEPLRRKNLKRFEKLERKYRCRINFIIIDESFIRNYPIRTYDKLSLATYYRLLAADSLPDSIDKILYLDGDSVIDGDISAIWNTEIENKAVIAVRDIIDYSLDRPEIRLDYPTDATYFNAGVMLINLDYWRANSVGEKCLAYLGTHYDKLCFYDQDVLNAVLWDKTEQLPQKYNFQVRCLQKDIFKTLSSSFQDHILRVFEQQPLIIHYNYLVKPWSIIYYNMPFAYTWKKYKRLSPWSGMLLTIPKRKTLRWLIKRFILWPVGVKTLDDLFVV